MIAALIIAAGKTENAKSFSPQKEVGAISALRRIALLFKYAGIERIVIVCDEEGDPIAKLASHMNAIFLHGRKDADMLDNVKVGLNYLQDKCTSAIITHSDVPLFSLDTVRALMNADGQLCVPSYKGRQGHPILLRAAYFPLVLTYAGEAGLSGALKTSGLPYSLVEVDDEGILAHIDHADDFTHLLAGHSLRHSRPDLRIRIVKEKPFYGPGAHQLMQLVEETHSLRDACRRMGISYGKGRAIMSLMEQQLGYTIIESQQGGSTGGHSELTMEGKELMRKYSAFSTAATRSLQELFDIYFPDEE